MAALQLLSSQPLAGKTTVAAGLGRGFADLTQVSLVRVGEGAAADADAASFAAFLFAGSPGRLLAPAELEPPAQGRLQIVELDAAGEPLADLPALVVVRGPVSPEDEALAKTLGDRLLGSIATNLPQAEVESRARDLTNAGMRPLALLPEEQALAAPCVAEIRQALDAELLYEGENDLEVVEDIVVGPVFADPAQPHFRRFDSKAILAPFSKTDLLMAAIETEAACLVITGGGRPSPYLLDRAQGEATTVMLAQAETPATIAALADVFFESRFRGESKLRAAHAALSTRLGLASLLNRIENGS